VVAVPEAAFAGMIPKTIPVAPRNYTIQPAQTLLSVGCANGTWSTGWKGHALGYRGVDLHFVPPPANGRSGSAIFDATGERIVGLLRARNEDHSEGIATSLHSLYAALSTESPSSTRNANPEAAQCPDGSCPTPWRLLPYRHYQDEHFRQIQNEKPNTPWPTLPVQPATPSIDLSPTNRRLDQITELLIQMRSSQGDSPVPTTPPAADAVLEAAEQAKAEAASIRRASEEAMVQVREESDRLRQTVDDLLGDRDTLRERLETRIGNVKGELGEEAGTLDVARAYSKDLLAEKLSDGSLGLTTGKVLGGALGFSGPLAAAVAAAAWLVSRRLGRKMETGDPLLVTRLFSGVNDRIDDLRDRLARSQSSPESTGKPTT